MASGEPPASQEPAGTPPTSVPPATGRSEASHVDADSPYRAIFEASHDGLIIHDRETGLVLEANPAACRMHGFEQMVGLNPTDFIHPDSHNIVQDLRRAAETGQELRARVQDVRQDGSVFEVEVLARCLTYHGRPAILSVVRDVTEQTRAYRMLEGRAAERTRESERRREVAEGLRDLLAAVNSLRSLDAILDYVVAQSRRLLGSDASAIFVPASDPDADALTIRASSGLEPEFSRVPMPVGVSPSGLAFKRRRPVVICDLPQAVPPASSADQAMEVEEHPSHIRVLRLPSLPEHLDGGQAGRLRAFADAYGAFLSVPLATKEEAYGALSLYFRQPRPVMDDDVALATVFADQTALAIENARLRTQAEQAAVLEERQRLARDLHDAVTQTLFSATLISEVIPDLWPVDPSAAQRRLEQLRRLTRGALAEMRILLAELRPGALTDLALADLLRQLADATAGNTQAEVAVTVDGVPTRTLPPDAQVTIYRIAQEAVSNAVKHARATRIALTLHGTLDGVLLRIHDDGQGFDPATIPAGHLGLSIMRERAAAVGACLRIASDPGNGTEIEIEWPGGEKSGQ